MSCLFCQVLENRDGLFSWSGACLVNQTIDVGEPQNFGANSRQTTHTHTHTHTHLTHSTCGTRITIRSWTTGPGRHFTNDETFQRQIRETKSFGRGFRGSSRVPGSAPGIRLSWCSGAGIGGINPTQLINPVAVQT